MSKEDKQILDTVLEKLDYNFIKDMLVKPLPDEYIEKEITKPVDTGKKDENGYSITDSKVEKEKVLTTFKKGIALYIPDSYQWVDENNKPKVGDTVVYARKSSIPFDLFKNSELVNPYNVVAFIKC